MDLVVLGIPLGLGWSLLIINITFIPELFNLFKKLSVYWKLGAGDKKKRI